MEQGRGQSPEKVPNPRNPEPQAMQTIEQKVFEYLEQQSFNSAQDLLDEERNKKFERINQDPRSQRYLELRQKREQIIQMSRSGRQERSQQSRNINQVPENLFPDLAKQTQTELVNIYDQRTQDPQLGIRITDVLDIEKIDQLTSQIRLMSKTEQTVSSWPRDIDRLAEFMTKLEFTGSLWRPTQIGRGQQARRFRLPANTQLLVQRLSRETLNKLLGLTHQPFQPERDDPPKVQELKFARKRALIRSMMGVINATDIGPAIAKFKENLDALADNIAGRGSLDDIEKKYTHSYGRARNNPWLKTAAVKQGQRSKDSGQTQDQKIEAQVIREKLQPYLDRETQVYIDWQAEGIFNSINQQDLILWWAGQLKDQDKVGEIVGKINALRKLCESPGQHHQAQASLDRLSGIIERVLGSEEQVNLRTTNLLAPGGRFPEKWLYGQPKDDEPPLMGIKRWWARHFR